MVKELEVQEACETLEDLLERESKIDNGHLMMKEFNALNKLLLEATVHLGYKVREENK
ncbi:hypothetical protein [Gracilibacillus dipsosauri]|uniref:hypothetical protein n=1 Tax=Gracilibacillus dipsosauri TaxID=178340 RepID=UPI0015E85F6E|nr:hypothetical protein [Gracilibacillus dipsosauri]